MTKKRPPIVAIMGHVDHGKTTLLDYIRKTNVASREAGGITQSIGAYEITHAGQKITFIDTPGHEAFSSMRGYGAQVADLAILVVAADDSVKPQTKDALKYILQEKIPYVVAINKIDKPGANIEKVKQDLTQQSVFLEGYGGDISWNAISAKAGTGVHELLDHLLLVAEIEDLSYNPEAPASGVVIGCKVDERRGLVVSVLVHDGTLRKGSYIGTKNASGKVKMMENFLGQGVEVIEPSAPALIIGFESMPKIGEAFVAGETKEEVLESLKKIKETSVKTGGTARAEADMEESAIAVILKADEAASLEVLHELIKKLSLTQPLVIKNVEVGSIYEGDVKAAQSTNAVILGFRTKVDKAAANLARASKIMIIESPIIYELEKELITYCKKFVQKAVRAIEILAIFGAAKGKERVVGGKVLLGPIKNHESFEIWAEKRMLGKGRIINLQSGRKDVPEALAGQEVGLLAESDEPIKVGERLVFE